MPSPEEKTRNAEMGQAMKDALDKVPERSTRKVQTVYIVITQSGPHDFAPYNVYSNREAAEKCASRLRDRHSEIRVDIHEWGVLDE